MMRHEAPGVVYIAGSHGGGLLKIGTTINVADRHAKLNEYRYGGQADWQMLATASCAAAGIDAVRPRSGAQPSVIN